MVNVAVTPSDALRTLVVGYAAGDRRAAFAALLDLDAALGQVLRTTRQPVVGQMRLAWWREALMRLDDAPPPGEPVLAALADTVLPLGVTGTVLATMIDGWEPLLGEVDVAVIGEYARRRGAGLFDAAGRVLGGDADWLAGAGEGWALADLASNLGDATLAAAVREQARPLLRAAAARRWPRAIRPLGALVHLARAGEPATARRVLRLGWHRLTGR